MKKIVLVISIPFFSFFSAFSQDSIPQNNFDIHFMPLTMIDYTPRFRLGIEYIHNKVGYDLELGYGYSYYPDIGLRQYIWDDSYRFFEIRPEIKYYLSGSKHKSYFSCELFYINLKAILKYNYYYSFKDFKTYRYDKAKFLKIKYGVHFKYGYRLTLFHSRLSIDIYEGAGIARRQTKFENIINPKIILKPIEEWFVPSYNRERVTWLFHLTFGIKIGLQL